MRLSLEKERKDKGSKDQADKILMAVGMSQSAAAELQPCSITPKVATPLMVFKGLGFKLINNFKNDYKTLNVEHIV